MDEKVIIEGNKLIAEFMGETIREDGKIVLTDSEPLTGGFIASPKYHWSWDWLMPVISYIERMGHSVHIIGDTSDKNGVWNYTNIYHDIEDPLIGGLHDRSKIRTTWIAVVEFIKWHNQTK